MYAVAAPQQGRKLARVDVNRMQTSRHLLTIGRHFSGLRKRVDATAMRRIVVT